MKLSIVFLVAYVACCASAQWAVPAAQSAPDSEYPETLLPGIPFDCSNKQTGPNKDAKYMDVFHACVHGKQMKTYGCPQVGGRFHYNDATVKCEGCEGNACSQGQFYQPMVQPPPVPTNAPVASAQPMQPSYGAPAAPAAPMRHPAPAAPQPSYGGNMTPMPNAPAAQANQDGSDNSQDLFRLPASYTNNPCTGSQTDGQFFASTYANVFHRCVANGIRKDFKCAKAGAMGQYDLWWDQKLSQCNYPCLVQSSLPLFMSQMSPQQVQQLDRTANGPLCSQQAAPAQPQQPAYPAQPQAPAPAHPAQPGYGK